MKFVVIAVLLCVFLAVVYADDSCKMLNAVQEINTIGSLYSTVSNQYAKVNRKQVKSFLETGDIMELENEYSDQIVVTEYLVEKKDSDSTIGDFVTLTTLNVTTANFNAFGNAIASGTITFKDDSPVTNFVSVCSFADIEKNAAKQSGFAIVNAVDNENNAVLMILEKQSTDNGYAFVEHSTIQLKNLNLKEDKYDDHNINAIDMDLEVQMDIGSSARQIQSVIVGKDGDVLDIFVMIYSKSSKMFNLQYDLSSKETHIKNNKVRMIVPQIAKVNPSVSDGGKFAGTFKVLENTIVASASMNEAEYETVKTFFSEESRPTFPEGAFRAPFLMVFNKEDLAAQSIKLVGSKAFEKEATKALTLYDFDTVGDVLMIVANSIAPQGKNLPVKMDERNIAVLETYSLGENVVGDVLHSNYFSNYEEIVKLASEHVKKLINNKPHLNVRLTHVSKSNFNTMVVAAIFVYDYEKPLDHKTNFVNLDPKDINYDNAGKLEVQKDGNDMILDLRPRVTGKKVGDDKSLRNGVVAAIVVDGLSTEFVPSDYVYATASLANKGVLWDIDCEPPKKSLQLGLQIFCGVVFIITVIIIAIMIVSCGSLLVRDIIKSLSKRFSKNSDEVEDGEKDRLIGNEQ
mmetsp:Transcript_6236/g.9059  ORF Transcript_6236/g.9059 Transcript_6236/m.9059 type:complete len:629 (-) Transcript_6236:2811-4697(-)